MKLLNMLYFAILMITVSSMTTGKLLITKAASKTKLTEKNGCPLGFHFKTVTGVDVPIRMNRDMEIECLSFNGRDCEWGKVPLESQCADYINKNLDNIEPLVCGNMHQRVHGSLGYGNPIHWCEKGREFFYEDWHCEDETGMDTPIKFDPVTKNVECLSSNGKDCIRDQNVCANAHKKSNSNWTPLICGSNHQKVYGGQNPYYSDNAHWCKQGNQWLTGTSSWFCGGDSMNIDTPLRYNEQGDMECFSTNARDCAWGNGTGQKCVNYVNNNYKSVRPLVCGAHHKAIYSGGGYDSKNHWCYNSVLKFVLKGRQE